MNSDDEFAHLVGLEHHSDSPVQTTNRQLSTECSEESIKTNFEHSDDTDVDHGVQMEETSKGKVKGSVSMAYFTAAVHWSVFILLACSLVFVQMIASGADYWVSVWYVIEMKIKCFDSSILELFKDLKF